MRRPPAHRRRLPAAVVAIFVLVAACGTDSGDGGAAPGPSDDEAPAAVPAPPEEPNDPFADFDGEAAQAAATPLLGVPEDLIEVSPMRRIVRRGDEHFAVTMDLRPGRENLELDDDGSGRYVVTRVEIETPDGPPIVVE